MKENSAALYSEYIIDGMRMDETPAQMLGECMARDCSEESTRKSAPAGQIIDESRDPTPGQTVPDEAETDSYLQKILALNKKERGFLLTCPDFFTRLKTASAVIDCLWLEGHFRLENITMDARWEWDSAPVGNMTAFYASARALSEYAYDLGVTLSGFGFSDLAAEPRTERPDGGNGAEECLLKLRVTGACDRSVPDPEEEDLETGKDAAIPHRNGIRLEMRRRCADTAVADPKSRLLYIPFDTCRHRLGGSLLEQVAGPLGDPTPEIRDPDYFMDCFEVLRELAEDGIIAAGVTVSDGGLLTAASKMCSETGADLDISGIMSSYMEQDMIKILFAEIPGVIIQIRGADFDYVDSQLLLQDIAYYPIGSPCTKDAKVTAGKTSRQGVAGILAALMYGQGPSEGED